MAPSKLHFTLNFKMIIITVCYALNTLIVFLMLKALTSCVMHFLSLRDRG